ncbi:hypothetical protein HBI67_226170 [Parastagonospora nodorum]|nr:hypothetical protein HBI67_226170 [Parastagonospora nodorum]
MRTVEARPGQHQCKDADDTSFLKTAQLTTLHSKQESGNHSHSALEPVASSPRGFLASAWAADLSVAGLEYPPAYCSARLPPCIESPIDPAGAHTPNRMSRIVLVFASDEGFDSCLEWIERIVLKQGRTHRNAC